MSEYSPIQPRTVQESPSTETFPSVVDRVTQDPDPYQPIEEREIQRATYQGNELCNLKCPGCYAGEWLRNDGAIRARNEEAEPGYGKAEVPGLLGRLASKRVALDTFEAHLDALGPDLIEINALGAELTAAPEHSREIIDRSSDRGLAVMAVTNGARKPEIVDRTLLHGLESGKIYKLNISLDSIDETINDSLRGKKGATSATLETVRRYAERGFSLCLQMTVWPRNYSTILDSIDTLYKDYGIRSFSFHCGTTEGKGDRGELDTECGGALEPLAWRALTDRLQDFSNEHSDDLQYFSFPYIFFTEQELEDFVIGDKALMDQFRDHTRDLEAGRRKPLPFNACPGIGLPQVYVYANDVGENGIGKISACNIDTGTNDRYVAEFDEKKRVFVPYEDPEQNQLAGMTASPNLCPAVAASKNDLEFTGSDRVETPEGDLYHACRYISINQMPRGDKRFPKELYEAFAEEYSARFNT